MGTSPAIKSIRDLRVYRLAYELALEIFQLTKRFPKSETYSLVDQMLRSSRSVASNIREGYAKRRYENIVIRHFSDALGSAEETRTWLDFSRDAGYITNAEHESLEQRYDELSAMLYRLVENWHSIDEQSDLRPLSSDL